MHNYMTKHQVSWSNQDITVLGVTITHEDILSKNYDTMLDKSKTILKAWYNRGLSIMGKVQVVNTLIASLFVYKMMVLPSIPKRIIQSMDNIIREFLWNGKKSKIAYNILQSPKREGGLNLVNLANRDKALKATWPQILHTEEEYATLVYSIMRVSHMGQKIWRCRISPEDVEKLKIPNVFWKQVWKNWSEYNYYINFRIENQVIWYNSNIKIGGKCFLWADALQKGLEYVHQLFEDCNYKSEVRIKEEFNISSMRYNSLKSALPVEWKNFFLQTPKQSFFPVPPHTYDQCIDSLGLASKIYAFLAEDAIILHNKYLKWRQELGSQFCETLIDFRDLHRYIYRVTNVPKYRSFQYRLLQRGLITNIQLEKWGLKASNMCSFCKQEIETIPHLMSLCPHVRILWQELTRYVQGRYGQIEMEISTEAIIANRITGKVNHIVNFMCLLLKQYIYSQKCLGKQLHFPIFKAKLREVECIEKYIAAKNNRLNVHNAKWVANSVL